MRLELNEYRQFIRAKGLKVELSTFIKKDTPIEPEKPTVKDDIIIKFGLNTGRTASEICR